MTKMTTHIGDKARTFCTRCWRSMKKEVASATWETREAFLREVASELTWKAEWEPAKQIGVKGTVQGTAYAKMHLAGSVRYSVGWKHRVDRDGAERGRLGR